jgi:hypothetical protein
VVAPEHEVRPRNTLLLLLVLAALGAYLYWVELPHQKSQAEEKRLVAVDKDAVTGITLAYPDQTITLEKTQDGAWRITKPIEADADETTVKNLLSAVADAQVTRSLEDAGDKLASYGLQPPEATVTLSLKDGGMLPPLKIGKTTQVGFAAYAQKGDDPKVYITGAALQSGVKKQVKDLRDKTVIVFDDANVQKLELKSAAGDIVVERGPDPEHWTIVAPARHPADPAEMRALLASVRGIRADDFVSDDAAADLKTYGLVDPRLAVSVWLGKDQAQKTLLIGGTHEEQQKKTLYAKRAERPTVYTVPDYALKNIDKDLATLRDKTVLAFDKEKAAKITLTRKDGTGFTIAKRDGTWHLETPGEGAERAPTISRFVEDLAGLKGSEIVAEGSPNLAKYGLDAPDVTLTIEAADGTPVGTLLAARGTAGVATEPDAKAYATAKDSGIIYGMKPFVFDRIDKKATDFREPPTTPVPSGFVTPTPGAPEAAGGIDEPFDAGDEGGDEEGEE